MKISDYLKERFLNTEDFYTKIISNNYPFKYRNTGKYLKNLFTIYGYSRELVLDSIAFFDYLSKNKFDFRNFDYFIIRAFNSFLFVDYHALFEIYDNTFIKKNYMFLYNNFDEFRERLKRQEFKFDDTHSDLAYLTLVYMNNKVNIREKYIDNYEDAFVEGILRIITILTWLDNCKDPNNVTTLTDLVLLQDDFIDKCVMKGFDITSLSYNQINFIGTSIYNNEFNGYKKKVIK